MHVPLLLKRTWLKRPTRELYYIHIPKCGGSFVERAFLPWIRRCPTQALPAAAGHLTYLEYRNVFAQNGLSLDGKQIFTAVRNPWDWHVSWFHYIRQDPGGRKSGHRIEAALFAKFTFADYVNWLGDPDAPRSPQGYIQKQIVDFIRDADGEIVASDILRQESLARDLRDFCERYDLAAKLPAKKVNASVRPDYRKMYTSALAEIIAKRHADDIATFGYTF